MTKLIGVKVSSLFESFERTGESILGLGLSVEAKGLRPAGVGLVVAVDVVVDPEGDVKDVTFLNLVFEDDDTLYSLSLDEFVGVELEDLVALLGKDSKERLEFTVKDLIATFALADRTITELDLRVPTKGDRPAGNAHVVERVTAFHSDGSVDDAWLEITPWTDAGMEYVVTGDEVVSVSLSDLLYRLKGE